MKFSNSPISEEDIGSTVVKVPCYKSEGRWFHHSWCHCIFHWHKILPIALWHWGRVTLKQKWIPGVFPVGIGGRCVRLTTLPPYCAVVTKSGSLNFLEPSGPVQACNGTALPLPLQMSYIKSQDFGKCQNPVTLWDEIKRQISPRGKVDV
jgi:hypothetical protein